MERFWLAPPLDKDQSAIKIGSGSLRTAYSSIAKGSHCHLDTCSMSQVSICESVVVMFKTKRFEL